MKKEIKIFKKKVPILAIMMAIMVIGTASAALISNYGTLSGTYQVKQTFFVLGDNEENDLLIFGPDGRSNFIIVNTGDYREVEINTTLYLDLPVEATPEQIIACEVTDTEGITVTVDGTPLVYENGKYNPIIVQILYGEPEIIHIPVIFDADPALLPGIYTIQVKVNPISTPLS